MVTQTYNLKTLFITLASYIQWLMYTHSCSVYYLCVGSLRARMIIFDSVYNNIIFGVPKANSSSSMLDHKCSLARQYGPAVSAGVILVGALRLYPRKWHIPESI